MWMLLYAACAHAAELDSPISGGPIGIGGGGNLGTTATTGVTGASGGSSGAAGSSSGGASTDGTTSGTGASAGRGVADSSASGGGSPIDVAQDGAFDGNGGPPPGAANGSCDPTKWRVSASLSAPADTPGNAVDGNSATRWSTGTGQSFGQYYQIDFGGQVRLSEIVLDNTGSPGDHPRGYRVEISDDGIDFSNVIASGALADGAPPLVVIDFSAQAIHLLRIELLTNSGSWWSIHELRTICQVSGGDGG